MLAGKDKSLLISWDALSCVDLGFDALNCICGFGLESNGLSRESFDEELHFASSESEDEVNCAFFLDVIVCEGSGVVELLSCEDESLLVGRDAFSGVNLGLDALDGVGGLGLQGDRLSRQCLDEELHLASPESEDEVESGLLLNVIVAGQSAVFEALPGEDQSLLVFGDAFLCPYLVLDDLDSVRGLDVKGDCSSGECLYEDLH